MTPAWLARLMAARGLCRCGAPGATEDAQGRLWCWPCWETKLQGDDAR